MNCELFHRYINDSFIPANGAYVGLAPPGDVGSWQTEVKVNEIENKKKNIIIKRTLINIFGVRNTISHIIIKSILRVINSGRKPTRTVTSRSITCGPATIASMHGHPVMSGIIGMTERSL